MQIKTTMRYHLTPDIKKNTINVGEDVEEREPFFTLLVGMEIGEATMENSMKSSQKIKNRTTI